MCKHWLEVLNGGETKLDYKKLLSDRGFTVYVTQAYPGMKPYLKGFHLLLETWQGGRDSEGWRVEPKAKQEEEDEPPPINMKDIKLH